MKLRGKLGVSLLVLAFILALAYIANAGMGGSVDDRSEQATNGKVSSDNENTKAAPAASQSQPGGPATTNGNGTMRVDRDFGAYHQDDSNQFGDDLAYDSSDGRKNREADYQSHHWTPETHGQMGDYGHDEK